ncbi:DAK2 domain-containing protein [Halanaerobium hydrogeniformans]|uniref:DegV family protein n=1 Tax=Halanaerobium hydrogeniformans TaxID=656519 RepID=E4RN47_HALHG|nr:DegV family protein [Halanaerobium hydrogeniformans]ADQ14264.1 degV family protein [Halanaerobium hydrogeniformans]
MQINYLDGKRLYYAVLSGSREVIKNRRELNETNVFPVADGDTGTNLSQTLNVVKTESVKDDSLNVTLNSMGDAALKGAIGNSGIIFAQFINGLKKNLADKASTDLNEFAAAVENAVEYTYQGMSNPVEGTILTVMKDWAGALKEFKYITDDFAEAMEKSLETAFKSLQQTKEKLQVLKDADVVDSGAQAFVYFLEGIVDFIKSGNIKEISSSQIENIERISEKELSLEEEINHRYCTEAYLENLSISIDQLREEISYLGDSLIVAGDKEKLRVHIHTNNPEELFADLDQLADIIDQKADDMLLQYQVKYNKNSETAILTDSIADLPREFIDKHQIHLLPLNILIDGTNYLDKLTLDSDKFFEMLEKAEEYPSSAQPAIKTIENKLAYLADHYQSIIVITVSQKMSGTYDNVAKAAEKIRTENENLKIDVIDSRSNSGAQGLLVMEAAEQLSSGKSYQETVAHLEKIRKDLYIYVSVDDFKYMVKGGRVSPLKGKIANFLNLKPIISIDRKGNGIALAKAFSKKGNFKKIKAILKEHQENRGIKRYAIVHGDDRKRAEMFAESFEELLGQKADFVENISPIVAINAGRGSTAVAVLLREEG